MRPQGLGASSLTLTIGMFSTQVLTAVTYWGLARLLTPDQLGPVVAAVGLAVFFAAVADFGINTLTVRSLATNPLSDTYTKTYAAKRTIAVALGTLYTGGSVVSAVAFGTPIHFAMLGLYVGTTIMAATVTVPNRAKRNMGLVATVPFLEKLSTLITAGTLSLTLVEGSEALTIGYAAGGFASLAVAYSVTPRIPRPPWIGSARQALQMWRTATAFGLVGVAGQMQRVDTTVVTLLAGAFEGGLFAVPSRLLAPLTLLPSAFAASLLPHLSAASSKREALGQVFRWGSAILVALASAVLIIWPAADVLIETTIGPDYLAAIPALGWYLVAALITAVVIPIIVTLQALHDERAGARVALETAIVSLCGVALGAQFEGARLAALGYAVGQSWGAVRGIICLHRTFSSRPHVDKL